MTPTHKELVAAAARHLRGTRKCDIVLTEKGGYEIADAIGWNRTSILIECKTSIADFYADQKKPGRREQTSFQGLGHHRFYLTPKGLLDGKTLPPRWGWLELRGSRVFTRIKAVEQPQWNLASETRILMNDLRSFHIIAAWYDVDPSTWEDKIKLFEKQKHDRVIQTPTAEPTLSALQCRTCGCNCRTVENENSQ